MNRQFLGLPGYYRHFVKNFLNIIAPLSDLTRKDALNKVHWTEANVASEKLKQDLITEPVLTCPDPSKPYILQTDASGGGIGAVLSQMTRIEKKKQLHSTPGIYC